MVIAKTARSELDLFVVQFGGFLAVY